MDWKSMNYQSTLGWAYYMSERPMPDDKLGKHTFEFLTQSLLETTRTDLSIDGDVDNFYLSTTFIC